jgi:hypothetical protein
MEKSLIQQFTFYNYDMALKDQPYMPLYVQDFLTDEKLNECSASATGVYIKIMCLMHKSPVYGTILVGEKFKQTDNQINNFALKFASLFGFTFAEVEGALKELIREDVLQLDGDCLSQKRMVYDGEISVIRSTTGSLGGKKTQELFAFGRANDQGKNKANTDSDNETETLVLKELKKEFETFWILYDKKVGEKGKLFKKWCALKPCDRTAIMEYIPKYKLAQPDKTYRKHPATFLNNKSWLDELIYAKPVTNGAEQRDTKSNGKSAGAYELLGKLEEDIRHRGATDSGG